MAVRISARILSNRLPAFSKELQREAARAVRETATAVAGHAFTKGHRITTSMVESVYVSGPAGHSTYAAQAARARAVNPHVIIEPEHKPATSAEQPRAIVGVAARHGPIEEYWNGHPWFYHGVPLEEAKHTKRARDAVQRAERAAGIR